MTRDQQLAQQARLVGLDLTETLKIGGRYSPVLRHGGQVHVSGQVPRIGDRVVVTGRAGGAVSLAQAQQAARICAVRALVLLQQGAHTLDAVSTLLRMNVFVQCEASFTQLSEVADAASDLVVAVLGDAGRHVRTSIGVYQLPKDATVELDLLAAVAQAPSAVDSSI